MKKLIALIIASTLFLTLAPHSLAAGGVYASGGGAKTVGQSFTVTVTASGATLGAILEELNATYPGLGERILDEQGAIRRFVNIFVNDEDVRFLQEKETPVSENDEVSIVPAIAGG